RDFEREKKAKVFSAPNLWITLQRGQWMNISDERMAAWSAAYPGSALAAELLRAAARAATTPRRGPKSDFAPFINRWLKRSWQRSQLDAKKNGRAPGQASLRLPCDNAPGCESPALVLIVGKDKREHNFCSACGDRFRTAELAAWVNARGGA